MNVIYKVNMVHAIEAKPRERRREATSERILEAAERILEAEGMAALTMQRLASEVGYTVGAAYRYFDSKDAILAALQRRVFDALGADLAEALARYEATSPRVSMVGALTRVSIVARTYASIAARRPTHARLLLTMSGDPRNVLPEGFGGANAAVAMRIGGQAVRELAAAQGEGALSAGDDVERALLLWASLQGIAQAKKLERWGIPGLDTDRLGDRMVATLLVGWGADPGRAREALARAREIVG